MMATNPSCLATMVLDVCSHDSESHAIEQFATRHHERLGVWAERLIHRCHLIDPAFGSEDATQDALFTLWKAMNDGKIGPIAREEDLVKLVRRKLAQSVLHERARENAQKRHDPATVHGGPPEAVRHLDSEIEPVDRQALPPDEQAIADEVVECWLRLLDCHDPTLRAIATRKADGFSHREIAAQLGVALSTVEHRLYLISAAPSVRHLVRA